jgi:penicillin-binding protein 2
MFNRKNTQITGDFIKKRLNDLFIMIILIFAILLVNLWYLQIIKGHEYEQRAINNCIRSLEEEAPRGEVFDKDENLLITNRPAVNFTVIPAEIEDYHSLSYQISSIIPLEESYLINKFEQLSQRPFQAQTIVRGLEKEQIIAFEEQKYKYKGTLLTIQPERKYLYQDFAAHVLGYVNEISEEELQSSNYQYLSGGDIVGKSGIEKHYDAYLRGKKGSKEVEVDALGREILTLKSVEPVAGNDIYLTLDSELQLYIQELMTGLRGAVMVSEARTGKILAMISQPGYDPNLFNQQISIEKWEEISQSEENILCNRSIQGVYPPGSVFKLITAIAALEEGVVGLNDRVYCPGYFELGNLTFKCWRETGHGTQTFRDAISNSCNVFFYTIGQRLGIDRLNHYATMFGLGEKTAIDLPGELSGLVPSQEWKRRAFNQVWFPGDTINLSIGQGYLLTTPFQIHNMLCIITNDGNVYRQFHVDRIVSQSGQVIRKYEPEIIRKVDVSADTFRVVKEGMKKVVEEGTGFNARVEGVSLAGKTGTAQNPQGENHGWFVGFAPYQNPEICVTVFVEHGGDGSQSAAPIASDIIEHYFRQTSGQAVQLKELQ